jgi:biotin carboxyl carrier protein
MTMNEEPELSPFVIEDREYQTVVTTKFKNRKKYTPPDPKKITCIIPGIIQKIYVKEGQRIRAAEPLLVLEAMKMQNDIVSAEDAIVKSIPVKVGQLAAKGQVLIEFK